MHFPCPVPPVRVGLCLQAPPRCHSNWAPKSLWQGLCVSKIPVGTGTPLVFLTQVSYFCWSNCVTPQPWPRPGCSSRQALWSALGHCYTDKSFQRGADLSQSPLAVVGMVPPSPSSSGRLQVRAKGKVCPQYRTTPASPELCPTQQILLIHCQSPAGGRYSRAPFTAGRPRPRLVEDRVMLRWSYFRGDRTLKRDCPTLLSRAEEIKVLYTCTGKAK